MKLSKLEWVILLLPVLGILDLASTFLLAWRGYPIYEGGLFASYFAPKGLLHLYVIVYLSILSGMTVVLIFIKREVSTDRFLDRLLLLLLIAAVCLIEAFLTSVIVSNFLLGQGRVLSDRRFNELRWLIYFSVFASILAYTWDEIKDFWIHCK